MNCGQGRVVVGAVTFLCLAACQRQQQENPTQEQSAASASVTPPVAALAVAPKPAAFPETTVGLKVLEFGAQPRRELRYSFKKGFRRNISLEQRNRMEMMAGNSQVRPTELPTVKTVMQWEVTHAVQETAVISLRVLSAEFEQTTGNPSTAQTGQTHDEFKAISATLHTDSRGSVHKVELDTNGVNKQKAAQALAPIMQSMVQALAQLPEEKVGVGAKWQVTSHVEQHGVQISQRATYTATYLDAKEVRLNVATEQWAPPGKITPPGMPGGPTMDLLGLTATGQGKTQLEFLGAVSKSELDLTTTMRLQIPTEQMGSNAGKTLQMNMTTRLLLQAKK